MLVRNIRNRSETKLSMTIANNAGDSNAKSKTKDEEQMAPIHSVLKVIYAQ